MTMKKLFTRGLLAASAFLLASLAASEIQAQTTFTACRVPDVGAIYMIGVEGAPSACLDQSHIEFSWTEGSGSLAEGSVTTTEILDGTVASVDIGADAVTSAEIADGSVGSADVGFTYAASDTKGGVAVDSDLVDGFHARELVPGGTLPAGATIRGFWGMGWQAAAGGEFQETYLAFGYTLAAAPTAHFIPNGGTPPAGCPGTSEDPQADPGHLCVYEDNTGNTQSKNVCSSFSCPAATPWGVQLRGFSVAAGSAWMRGTWAVTGN